MTRGLLRRWSLFGNGEHRLGCFKEEGGITGRILGIE